MVRRIAVFSSTLLVLLSIALPLEAQQERRTERPKAQSFDSDGVKIHYIEKGEGEPVILIHGFTASAAMNWQQPGVFDAVAKHYRAIALDNRGHGRSDKPHDPEAYGVEMVRDVLRLMDHLEIDRAHLVGYSMGGFITNKLLSMHPERVISATLGGAGWSQENDSRLDFVEELATSLEQGKGIGPLLIRLTPPGQPVPTEEQIAGVNPMLALVNDMKALGCVARGLLELHVPEQALRDNQVPVLALIGDLDPLKESVDDMDGVMANLRVVVLEGADHMNTFREPLFVETLLSFLAECSAAQPVAAGE